MRWHNKFFTILLAYKLCHCDKTTEVTGQGTEKKTYLKQVKFQNTPHPLTKTLFDLLSSGNISTFIDDNLSPEEIEDIIHQYNIGSNNEDIELNFTQLVTKYGYPAEQHLVQTDDGYILSLFRIPRNGTVVFLMHGLLSSSDDWVTAGPNSGIAYLLASEGYDVWLGNARGNRYSRKHKRIPPSEAEFWNFSWDEIGLYDLPAMIDYVLKYTGGTKLKYIGHSQGTTSFFVMCSMKPAYNDKISLMVALSAVAWMSRVKSPIVRLVAPIHPFIHVVFNVFGLHEFQMTNAMRNIVIAICRQRPLAEILCGNFLFLLVGFNSEQMNFTNMPVFFGHLPAGAATKQLMHYGQGVVSGKFRRYDHGVEVNLRRYRSETPPDYPVEKITAPVAIFASNEDWLADINDVQILRNKLCNVVYYYVPVKKINHMDFLWAKDLKTLLFGKLLKLLKKF